MIDADGNNLSRRRCYTTPDDVQDDAKLSELGRFCRRMGRETNQGEIGLVIGDEYIAIRNMDEE